MNTAAKIAALSPVALAAVGLTQAHYLVSHFSTIAEIGAAIAVGAAVWTGKSITGRRKAARANTPNPMDTPGQAHPLLGQFVDYSLPVADPVAHVDWDRVVREYQVPPVKATITRR